MTAVARTDDTSRVAATVRAQRRNLRRSGWTVLALAAILVLTVIGDASMGSDGFDPTTTLRALLNPGAATSADLTIVWQLRMPMTATAVLVGAALAMAGAQMQTILDNSLAEPYTLGVSAAASFGAALSVVIGVGAIPLGGYLGTAGIAWTFAMISTAVVLAASTAIGGRTDTMVLLGIAMVFLFSALLALMQYMASSAQLEQVVFWTLGSVGRADWTQVIILATTLVVAFPALLSVSWRLTAMRLGDDRAAALGVRVTRLRIVVLAGVSLVAATAVSISGSIGFVGLVGPHIARLLVGETQRYFLPASMLSGAIVLCGSSMVAKLLVPGVLMPVGIVTSIVGVPVFVTLILTRRGGA